MLKNNKYYYKSFDLFDVSFGDDRVFDVFNPYGYNIESNNRRYKNNEKDTLKSKDNNRFSMSNDLKR